MSFDQEKAQRRADALDEAVSRCEDEFETRHPLAGLVLSQLRSQEVNVHLDEIVYGESACTKLSLLSLRLRALLVLVADELRLFHVADWMARKLGMIRGKR